MKLSTSDLVALRAIDRVIQVVTGQNSLVADRIEKFQSDDCAERRTVRAEGCFMPKGRIGVVFEISIAIERTPEGRWEAANQIVRFESLPRHISDAPILVRIDGGEFTLIDSSKHSVAFYRGWIGVSPRPLAA